MMGIVQFMRSLLLAAVLLGAAGTLVEATGIAGREAAKAQWNLPVQNETKHSMIPHRIFL